MEIFCAYSGADPGILERGGGGGGWGGPRLKSRLFTKDAVTAERIEFKIIQPTVYQLLVHTSRYLFKLSLISSVFIQRRVPCDFLHS